MIFLYVLSIILVLFVLLLMVPIGVDVGYDDSGLRLYARVSCITIQVFPMKKKEKKSKAAKKPKKKKSKTSSPDITKDEVLDDLPDKISYEQMVELSPEETVIYEKIRADVEFKFKKRKTKEERKEAAKLDISFFQELTRLRLLANSVSLVYPEWKPESSKVTALRDILTSLSSRTDNRVLIFSQFTSFLSQIGTMMKNSGFEYLYLDGQTPLDERQRLVDRFQEGECQFFLISLKAGGLGLNLTAANYVILMDPWWNPSIEDQATDRAHRIGQERNVTVIRLVSANTIEEKILKLHEQKQDLSDRILEGTSGTAALTMDEILDMVSPYR